MTYRSRYRCRINGDDESVVGCGCSQVDCKFESRLEAIKSGADPKVFEIEIRGHLCDIGWGRDLVSSDGSTGRETNVAVDGAIGAIDTKVLRSKTTINVLTVDGNAALVSNLHGYTAGKYTWRKYFPIKRDINKLIELIWRRCAGGQSVTTRSSSGRCCRSIYCTLTDDGPLRFSTCKDAEHEHYHKREGDHFEKHSCIAIFDQCL